MFLANAVAHLKLKWLAVLLAILLSASVALAESYQIQVAWQTRLREQPNVNAAIAEVMPAGSVLTVVGRFNRWLKIDLNGRTVWLADWVDYTRLDASPPPSAPQNTAPSQIDNCCFVDRQCQSERDWVDGYWAYQRQECPAQAAPESALPTTGGHPMIIQGSYLFMGIVTDALDALQKRAPHWYGYVTRHLNLVVEANLDIGCSHRPQAGTCCLTNYGKLPYFDRERNMFSYVSSLVHYACHSDYRSAGKPYNGYTKVNEEADCVSKDNAATDLVAARYLPETFGSGLGISHCEGDLTNDPRCRFVRQNCQWGPNGELLDCPVIGLRLGAVSADGGLISVPYQP